MYDMSQGKNINNMSQGKHINNPLTHRHIIRTAAPGMSHIPLRPIPVLFISSGGGYACVCVCNFNSRASEGTHVANRDNVRTCKKRQRGRKVRCCITSSRAYACCCDTHVPGMLHAACPGSQELGTASLLVQAAVACTLTTATSPSTITHHVGAPVCYPQVANKQQETPTWLKELSSADTRDAHYLNT